MGLIGVLRWAIFWGKIFRESLEIAHCLMAERNFVFPGSQATGKLWLNLFEVFLIEQNQHFFPSSPSSPRIIKAHPQVPSSALLAHL